MQNDSPREQYPTDIHKKWHNFISSHIPPQCIQVELQIQGHNRLSIKATSVSNTSFVDILCRVTFLNAKVGHSSDGEGWSVKKLINIRKIANRILNSPSKWASHRVTCKKFLLQLVIICHVRSFYEKVAMKLKTYN